MAMTLCLITDDVTLASEAEEAGVDRIMIDLERDGKAQRQAGRNLFLSAHRLESIAFIRRALDSAAIVVRTNPLSEDSAAEIEAVIDSGADFVMLPYFFGLSEVRAFIRLVGGRSRVILLVETGSAVERLTEIAREPGVDEVHIGLNDLSISLGHCNIFESICSGLIDRLAAILRDAALPFGFGGVARLSSTHLPVSPERMLVEQLRAGATRAWLGRTFRGDMERSRLPGELTAEVQAIRRTIARWQTAPVAALRDNHEQFVRQVEAWQRVQA